jgi:hypothetical protein
MYISENCVVVNGTSTKRYDEMDSSFCTEFALVSGDVGNPLYDVARQKPYVFIMEPTVWGIHEEGDANVRGTVVSRQKITKEQRKQTIR